MSRCFDQKAWLITCTLVVLSVAVGLLWPGVMGPFLLDDFANLGRLDKFLTISDYTILNYLSDVPPGGSGRYLAFVTFWLQDGSWPDSPFEFKLFNLGLHLFSGILVCLVAFKLFRVFKFNWAGLLAVAVMFVWLLQPMHASSVFYVVQRMTLLSGFFVLLSITLYIYICRAEGLGVAAKICAYFGVGVCVVLAVFSKENGILACLYLACLKGILPTVGRRRVLSYLDFLILYVPLIFLFLYFYLGWSEIESVYDRRNFTLSERLWTQSRVLWSYMVDLLAPNLGVGLFNSDYPLSRGWLSPWYTLPAVLSHIAVLVLCVRFRASLISVAILWFYMGHLLESTFVPLEIYFEHRNYIPSVGVAILLVVAAYELSRYRKVLGICLALVYLLLLSSVAHFQAKTWSSEGALVSFWQEKGGASVRAIQYMNNFWIKNDNHEALLASLEFHLDKNLDDVNFLSTYVLNICQMGLGGRIDERIVDAYIQSASSSLNMNGLHFQLNQLMNEVNGAGCGQLGNSDILELLYGLEKNKFYQYPTILSNTWYQIGYLESLGGNLPAAIKALDKATYYWANPIYSLQQSAWLMSAGLRFEAVYYLRLSEYYVRNSGYFRYKNYSEINMMKEKLGVNF